MAIENTNVTAVVVTYNRIEFLKEIINALRNQTVKLASIIVVNNSCSDGTTEWLKEQDDIHLINQENVGSSGGQYSGIKAAYDEGFDWIWTMDDDVVPEPNCLKILLEREDDNLIRVPLRYKPDGKPFYNDVIKYNLTNPLKKFWQGLVTANHFKDKYVPVEGITFEGPLFHRSVVERIGLPDKKFFIFGDDTEYFLRVKKFNIKIELCRDARLNRKLNVQALHEIQPSKKFYIIRNLIAINVIHGSLTVRLFRPIIIEMKELLRISCFADIKYILKGFFYGYFYKSENPPFKSDKRKST